MATEKEQLDEMRKEIILSRMEGKSDAEKARATRDLHRMNFTDHADFMSHVDDVTSRETYTPKVVQATDEEMDAIMGELYPGQNKSDSTYKPKAGEASSAEIEEMFKHMGI